MAATKGHGNPKWTRDETLLALDLYFDLEGHIPSSQDFRIQALSSMLRSAPYYRGHVTKSSFRNPDGVSFKLQNLRQVATGKGLGNVSETDRHVWREFGERKVELKLIADAIRNNLDVTLDTQDFDEEFREGKLLTTLHFRRERHRGLRRKLLDMKRANGLKCEICDIKTSDLKEGYQESIYEAHHLIPLSTLGEGITKLGDLALLCANCHRFIHRAIVLEKRWLTIQEARVLHSDQITSCSR